MHEADRLALVEQFNRAWNQHDLDAALALITDDCVFDSTAPAPDGERFQGKAAIRTAWQPVFDNPRSHLEFEEVFAMGERVVQRWRYSWGGGHVRGIDLLRFRDGKLTEKLSYVKG